MSTYFFFKKIVVYGFCFFKKNATKRRPSKKKSREFCEETMPIPLGQRIVAFRTLLIIGDVLGHVLLFFVKPLSSGDLVSTIFYFASLALLAPLLVVCCTRRCPSSIRDMKMILLTIGCLVWDWFASCFFATTWMEMVVLDWSSRTSALEAPEIVAWWWGCARRDLAAREINSRTSREKIVISAYAHHRLFNQALFLYRNPSLRLPFLPLISVCLDLGFFLWHNAKWQMSTMTMDYYFLFVCRLISIVLGAVAGIMLGSLPIFYCFFVSGESCHSRQPVLYYLYLLCRVCTLILLPYIVYVYMQLNKLFCPGCVDWSTEFETMRERYEEQLAHIQAGYWAQLSVIIMNERCNGSSPIMRSMNLLHAEICAMGGWAKHDPSKLTKVATMLQTESTTFFHSHYGTM